MNLTSFDENKFSLKRRRYITEQKRKYSRSFDYPYEIRQVQQQFSIEAPLPQPTNKNKPSHGIKKETRYIHSFIKIMLIFPI